MCPINLFSFPTHPHPMFDIPPHFFFSYWPHCSLCLPCSLSVWERRGRAIYIYIYIAVLSIALPLSVLHSNGLICCCLRCFLSSSSLRAISLTCLWMLCNSSTKVALTLTKPRPHSFWWCSCTVSEYWTLGGFHTSSLYWLY